MVMMGVFDTRVLVSTYVIVVYIYIIVDVDNLPATS